MINWLDLQDAGNLFEATLLDASKRDGRPEVAMKLNSALKTCRWAQMNIREAKEAEEAAAKKAKEVAK